MRNAAYTRSCICPAQPRQPGEHGSQCNDAYREGFHAYVQAAMREMRTRPSHHEDTGT